MTTKARLDADRTAKPLTSISAVHRAGDCVLPGVNARAYKVRQTDPQIRVVIVQGGREVFSRVYPLSHQGGTGSAIVELMRDFPNGEMKVTRV